MQSLSLTRGAHIPHLTLLKDRQKIFKRIHIYWWDFLCIVCAARRDDSCFAEDKWQHWMLYWSIDELNEWILSERGIGRQAHSLSLLHSNIIENNKKKRGLADQNGIGQNVEEGSDTKKKKYWVNLLRSFLCVRIQIRKQQTRTAIGRCGRHIKISNKQPW